MTSSLMWPSVLSLTALYVNYIALVVLLWKRHYFIAGFLFGLCWIASHAIHYQSWVDSVQQKASNFSIHGSVLAVDNNQYWQKITVSISQLNAKRSLPLWRPKVILYQTKKSKQGSLQLRVGQSIHAVARLKPAVASLNPAGFNYARWLVSQSVIAKGSVISLSAEQSQASFRSDLISTLANQLQAYPYGGEMLALMVGDKRLLSDQHMRLYREAGLSHLFVLSGLHLGIIGLWSWYLAAFICLLAGKQPRPVLAAFSFICCLIYCWLAGWQLPMIRALIMYGGALSTGLLLSRRPLWQGILVSAFIILLLWPFSIYSNSLWLSFSAVSIVLLCLWIGPNNRLLMLVFIQASISILLIPIQVLLFGVLPSAAVLINLVAVPIFTVLMVPMVMLLMALLVSEWDISQPWAGVVDQLFAWLHQALVMISNYQALSLTLPKVSLALLIVMGGCGVALLLYRRWLAVVFLSLAISIPAISAIWLNQPKWQILVLDVGQGLSVLILHNDEALIYDSGARFRSGFNYAESVIIPVLRDRQIKTVKYIITSHGDNDHAGGREILEQRFTSAEKYYGRDKRLPKERCSERVQWAELTLSFTIADSGHGNQGSCVVFIEDGHFSLLLTGDIEKQAEQMLLAQGLASSTFLVSPHHGSNSSSSTPFIRQLKPAVVIHSSGAFNRFGFPSDQVLQRYAGSQQHITGKEGAITIKIYDRSYQIENQRYRLTSPWYQQIISW
ncbi:DNA internalization-related competence protein ComEC/Rec2 [Agarivorans sp. MS3-6]